MVEFFQVLSSQSFLQTALTAGLLASLACGVIGTYVVAKRISFISGGIAHAVLGGMGLAYFWNLNPLHGALAAALCAALIIGVISLRAEQHEDTIIGALWAIGMAAGILFISRTPGYKVDLMSYLFGNIIMVTREDVYLIAGLDVVILVLVLLFYKQFLAVCFDEEFARLQGVPVDFIYILLLGLIAVTVVILIQVVGIILVIALLTLPAAIAQQYARNLAQMMILATVLGAVFVISGLAVSYGPDLPAGATIIIISGTFYILSMIFKALHVRVSSRLNHVNLKSNHNNNAADL
ncbi:MAG: metal ABC transporter permease [Deltaproteobacteria bacterium]|nr:metal ABC transporter permease [Deltaproteobacteria bacterium]MBW2051935.1 metal ABC transporter permease [Deltaproteobacteria bacterium]MBW2139890.1 metal ABC transporter permease [Deltaproteobacteria bacterium]MBW2322482.1 metal ABC transporter permease [Deltaproteobacteria bacterium]